MKLITVCVDYADLLSVTLPRVLPRVTEAVVVTSYADIATQRLCYTLGAYCFRTDAFFDDGALFNKWKALEEGLDVLGRDGLLCITDPDIVWPEETPMELRVGQLLSPYRRVWEDWKPEVPTDWKQFPLAPDQHEWAGFFQVFHASDPVLGKPPWHQTDWRHAGGADSFFQQKWAARDKVRPPWEVLHLGPVGINWAGKERREELQTMLAGRKVPGHEFRGERL